ncbi:hypothetical protein EDC94DRAFT_692247, partial [Helicostylum pulchrum]
VTQKIVIKGTKKKKVFFFFSYFTITPINFTTISFFFFTKKRNINKFSLTLYIPIKLLTTICLTVAVFIVDKRVITL